MAALEQSPAEMLGQLEQARKLCLADASVYNQIVPGIVPIIQTATSVDVRRWGADFIAEAFASPALPGHQKEQLISDKVMEVLRGMLEIPNEDMAVVKSAVQACASIYPFIFRKVISHPDMALVWRDMTTIKLNILQRLDIAPIPVRICCIKFLQKVVQIQTPGQIADPRRPEHNETSLALVPRNHPLLPLPNLEAETSGLLDRLLSVIQENSIDPLVIDPTMNCLSVLIRTRPTIANKILATLLNYNPLKSAAHPLTSRMVIIIRSLERTTRALLRSVMRWNSQHIMAPKIDAYLQRLQASKTAFFQGAQHLKRPAEPTDGLDDAKRQRLEPPRRFPPMPPPPHSFAQLFTLTEDVSLTQYDVKVLPEDMVSMISSALMQHIDSKSLDEAIEEVRQRYQIIQDATKTIPIAEQAAAGDEDDDYDPEALSGSDSMIPGMQSADVPNLAQPVLDLGPFDLPRPPPLSETELAILSEQTIAHVFETALSSEKPSSTSKQKLGINRLAASTNDMDSWLTVMIRIATRAPAGLDALAQNQTNDDKDPLKRESADPDILMNQAVPNRIRQLLFDYVLDDWHHRLPLGITWLTEEWYADRIEPLSLTSPLPATTAEPSSSNNNTATTSTATPTTKANPSTPNYNYWTARLFDTLIPRFDANDHRILIRFLSELPSVDRNILAQAKTLTRDPATVKICTMALQYLYLMRPPVREMVIDTMEEIWYEGDSEVKNIAGKILNKWRPGFAELMMAKRRKKKEEDGEGVNGSNNSSSSRTFPNGVIAEEIVT